MFKEILKFKVLKGTTPSKISEDIKAFSKKLVPNGKLQWVIVIPEAEEGRCFENVKAKVEKEGGEMVHGWIIWYKKHVIIDAEFHGVWKNEDGELIDITKKSGKETKILFLVDPIRIYEGKALPNVVKHLKIA